MNLKKKFVIGAASLALVAGMGVAPAMAAPIPLLGGGTADLVAQRVSGANRVATSVAIAKKAFAGNEAAQTRVYLVGSHAIPDAAVSGMLNGTGVDAAVAGPVVAIPSDETGQMKLALALKAAGFTGLKNFIAIGGTSVVSDDAVKTVVTTYGDTTAKTARIGGKTRYETAVNVAKKAYTTTNAPTRMYLTSGTSLVDALSAGTLDKGPIILVNPTGDIAKPVTDYVASLGKLNPALGKAEAVVIGGKAALSDEQVMKLWPSDTTEITHTTPWSTPEVQLTKKEVVQKAAAVYYGQGQWQDMSKAGDVVKTDVLKADDSRKTPAEVGTGLDGKKVFGLGATASVVGKNTSTEPENIVNIKAAVDNDEEAWIGYLPYWTSAKAALGAAKTFAAGAETKANTNNGKLIALKNDAAKTAGVLATQETGADPFDATTIVDADAKALYEGLVELYGAKAVQANWPTKTSDGKLDVAGMFKFELTDTAKAVPAKADSKDLADLHVVGWAEGYPQKMTESALAKKSATKADDQIKSTIAGYNATVKNLDSLAAEDGTVLGTAFALDKDKNLDVDKYALAQLVVKRYEGVQDKFNKAKADLVKALQDYFLIAEDAATTDSTTTGSDGIIRLAGTNRYETSAYISIYRTKTDKAGQPTVKFGEGHNSAANQLSEVYLASGAEANLIDSVFGGQLTNGAALLVPANGEIDPLVKTDLYYHHNNLATGSNISQSNVFALGGTLAVSDDVFLAAINAMTTK